MTFKNVMISSESLMKDTETHLPLDSNISIRSPSISCYEWSSGYSDQNTQSETSSTSWTDDAESDVTQYLQDQLLKFENSCYGDSSYKGLAKNALAESHLWSSHSLHLRVIGKSMKIEPMESDEVFDENFEEVFASHVDENTTSAPNDNGLTLDKKQLADTEKVSENSEQATHKDSFMEEMKNEVIQKLFDKVWPRVFEKVKPAVRTLSQNKPRIDSFSTPFIREEYSDSSTISADSSSSTITQSSEFSGDSNPNNYFIVSSNQLPHAADSYSRQNVVRLLPNSNNRKQLNSNIPSVITLPLSPVLSPELVRRNREQEKRRGINSISARSMNRGMNNNRLKSAVTEIHNKPRNGLLPPIEAIDMSAKGRSVRSSSAFLHCTKKNCSQPRLNSSRCKSGLLSPIENGNPELLIKSRKQMELNYVEKGLSNMKVEDRRKSAAPWKW